MHVVPDTFPCFTWNKRLFFGVLFMLSYSAPLLCLPSSFPVPEPRSMRAPPIPRYLLSKLNLPQRLKTLMRSKASQYQYTLCRGRERREDGGVSLGLWGRFPLFIPGDFRFPHEQNSLSAAGKREREEGMVLFPFSIYCVLPCIPQACGEERVVFLLFSASS